MLSGQETTRWGFGVFPNSNRSLLVLGALLCSSAFSQEVSQDNVVLIVGGTFWMGTSGSDIPSLKDRYDLNFPGIFENETPVHQTTISNFKIDRFEVTNFQFSGFLIENTEWRQEQLPDDRHNGDYLKNWNDGQYPEELAKRPVVYVTWSAAQAYCRWRGGRLPTEAEWEYVARAGDSREFPWGNALPSPERANYSASNHDATTDVGTYPPNDFGVYDLAGNVWEFLYDAWEPGYSPVSQVNPVGGGLVTVAEEAEMTGRRAVRGASFGGSVVNIRTRWRDSHVATNAIEFVGFRCAYPE